MNVPSTERVIQLYVDPREQFRIFIVVILGIYFKNNTTNSNNESTVYLKGNRFRICIVVSKFLLFSCMHFIQEIVFFLNKHVHNVKWGFIQQH